MINREKLTRVKNEQMRNYICRLDFNFAISNPTRDKHAQCGIIRGNGGNPLVKEEKNDELPDTSRPGLETFFARHEFQGETQFLRTMKEGTSGGLGTMRAKGGDVPSTKDRGRGDK